MDGSGEIDGQGSSWWNGEQTKCQRPIAVQFNKCNNLQLSGLTHLNPPNAHIQIFGTRSAYLTNLHINAPKDSPNTDGIKIGGSTHVQIHDSVIATGDDCIALLNGSNYINITNIACGPGHGISVGSLGGHGGYSVVEGVRVYNCSFNGTMNGARIKTFQGGQGYARKIHFDKITLIAAQNPIIIDQNYNVLDDSNINQETSVEVSDVTYSGFEGTSADEKAITIACSASPGCLNITMYGNNITSSVPGKDIYASCNNAKGTSKDTMPMVPCLSNNSNVQL
ncbi:probable polygalacturonase At3g15720 [Ziziphus jujuba]|nr:probable polygalacturonase At3g15720 [Ziziphus jujuba]